MKLYYHPLSTYSQKTLMAFHEKAVSFTPEIVDLMSPESRAAYKKVLAEAEPYLAKMKASSRRRASPAVFRAFLPVVP